MLLRAHTRGRKAGRREGGKGFGERKGKEMKEKA